MRARITGTIVVLAVVLAACGGGGSKQPAATGSKTTGSPGTESSTASTGATGSKASRKLPAAPCSLLSPDQVATVLPGTDNGKPLDTGVPTTLGCEWNATGLGILALRVTDLSAFPGAQGIPLILDGEGVQDVSGVGDGAKIGKVGPGPNLLARVGSLQVALDLSLPNSWPAAKDAMIALAKAVVAKL